MKHSPAVIIAEFLIGLQSSGLLTRPSEKKDWPLYVSSMPDGDDIKSDCAAIYDTSGILNGRILDNGEVIERYGFQIKVRSVEYEDGWQKISDIVAALDFVLNDEIEIDGTEYQMQNISRVTPIAPLGLEQGTKRRHLFTVNYLATIKSL